MGKRGLVIIVLFLALVIMLISGCVKVEQPLNETAQNITVTIVPEEKIDTSKTEISVLSGLESEGWASVIIKVEDNKSISQFIENITTNLSAGLNVTGRFSNGFSAEATKEAVKKLSNNENIREIYYYEPASAQLNADSSLCKSDYECIDKEICLNHGCRKLNCGQCYYPSNHSCVKTECCTNDDCKSSQICNPIVKICVPQICGYCQYAENHTCNRYDCCEERECKNTCFYHACVDAPTTISFETVEKGNTQITNRRILNYSILKNFDIGLLLIQTKEEWNNTRGVLAGTEMIDFSDFSTYFLLMVLQHSKKPADIEIEKIKQGTIKGENALFIYLNASENETGELDDAWHIIKIRRDNLTERGNLSIRITPTGKTIIGGDEMVSGANIGSVIMDGVPYDCVNITLREGEGKIVELGGGEYQISVTNFEELSGGEYVSVSVDGSESKRIKEGISINIGTLRIDANLVEYSHWAASEPLEYDLNAKFSYAELGVCYKLG